ncbi:unnamed protein product [Lupinus luteus]|uniref:Uncharacterized protein n=1 Tax=Lupinus luteus TaxID=3873 RepID=A0AAV1X3J6_LUPLU
MGTCLSKKKDSSNPSNVTGSKSVSTGPSQPNNVVTVTELELKLKKEKTVEEKQQDQLAHEKDEGQVKKEIFIIKHRKSHDDNNRERNSRVQALTSQYNVQPQQNNGSPSASTSSTNEASEKSMDGSNSNNNKTSPSTPNISMVRTSSCTKEEIDAILIQCGRLSRSPSSRAASSSGGSKYSGSKRSFDFDHCDSNETVSADGDQKRVNDEEHDDGKSSYHQHWQRHRHRQSPKKRGSSPSSHGRRRTPSREREQQQSSSSRERRVSRSPGKRSSEANNSNNNSGSIRPGKMVSVPATVTSLVMDKSNNGGGVIESAGVKRVSVKRNGVGVGDGSWSAASSRSQSPAGANGNGNQPYSLSRNNPGRKGEHFPYRRNLLSEVDPYSLAYPQSNTKNSNNKVQNNAKGREAEAEAIQKVNVDVNENSNNRISRRVALEKGEIGDCKIKEQQEEEINVLCSMIDNVAVKNVIQSSAGNLKQQPQTLTKSRSSRRSRELDLNPESLLNPTQTYTSLLLEDIHNFHQKTTQQQLPPCLTKACSILESVADL